MSHEQPISRRDALMAATVLGAVVGVAQAQDNGDKPFEFGALQQGGKQPSANPLKLQITLTDGQVVTFNASKAVITFGDAGSLVATPSGILPMASGPTGEDPKISPKQKPTFHEDFVPGKRRTHGEDATDN